MKRLVFVSIGILITLAACLTVALAVSKQHDTKSSTNTPAKQQIHSISPPTRAELLTLVNAERARNGAKPLVEDSRLDQSAQMKADDEVKYNYFGHISPENSPYAGKHGYTFINDVDINCATDGENLTENTSVNDAQHAVTAWINSPPHHTAMISINYDLTGFGISNDQIVEHFCQSK